MRITNNHLRNNPIGAICSDRCSNILIEINEIVDNTKVGIFFSLNSTVPLKEIIMSSMQEQDINFRITT